jgi:hypothetical protein
MATRKIIVNLVDRLAFWLYNKHLDTQKGNIMKAFILGTVFGLILATVGFSGIARMLDKGVDQVKVQSTELAK